MTEAQIQPHKVRNPIQLLAVWFAALVLLDGAFLTAAGCINNPTWVAPMLAIAAILFVPVFLGAAFLMQTKFRTHLQDDAHYSDWLKRKEEQFSEFTPENINFYDAIDVGNDAVKSQVAADPESDRVRVYERQQGLFLVHDWVPSRLPGQVADIMIWVHQHREGPLSRDEVERVEYYLGPMFFGGKPAVKNDSEDAFRLEIAAYAPVLCLARVFLKNQPEPIELARYIDFEITPEQTD